MGKVPLRLRLPLRLPFPRSKTPIPWARAPRRMPGFPGSPFRDDLFEGKTVLITGGATGMGLAMTHAFAAHGARVMICSRK